MGYDFRGKVAVITGASGGIGRATALALAREGATVVLAARGRAGLVELEDRIRAEGGDAWSVEADVCDPAQVTALVDQTLRRAGRIDILVASAGRYGRRPVRDLDVDELERMMAVNFYGAARTVLAVLPHMVERGDGRLVVLSSVEGKKGLPPDGAYVASKSALTGLCEVLRFELRGTGVGLCLVLPGRVDTPMLADVEAPWISAKCRPERVARAIVRGIRRGSPEVIVPYLTGKFFIVVGSLSAALADAVVRLFGLGGRERRRVGSGSNRAAA